MSEVADIDAVLWASDVFALWPAADRQALATACLVTALPAGQRVPDAALWIIVHGDVRDLEDTSLPCGTVVAVNSAEHYGAAAAYRAGAQGAVVAWMSDSDRLAWLQPRGHLRWPQSGTEARRDSSDRSDRHRIAIPRHNGVAAHAEGTERSHEPTHVGAPPRPEPNAPAAAPPTASLLDNVRALLLPPAASLRWHHGVAVMCLAALALALPLFVKFVVDQVLLDTQRTLWLYAAAMVALGATVLTYLLQNATHATWLASSHFNNISSSDAAPTWAALLPVFSTSVYPMLAALWALPVMLVMLTGGLAQELLMYAALRRQAQRLTQGETVQPAVPCNRFAVTLEHAADAVVFGATDWLATQLSDDPAMNGTARQAAVAGSHRFAEISYIVSYLAFGALLYTSAACVQSKSLSLGAFAAVMLMGHQLQSAWRALHRRVAESLPPRMPTSAPLEAFHSAVPHDVVTLRDVGLTYAGAATPALRDINIELRAGARLGVSGGSGSGQTTLARLCCGELQPSVGHIDAPADWPARAAYLPALLPWPGGVLRDNLTLGDDVGEAAVYRAVARAALESWLAALPAHLSTTLRDNDARSTASIRVCLWIAQTLLWQPSIWVMDHALDACSEPLAQALVTNIRRTLPQTTLVIVTKRPSLLSRCETVLELQDGLVHARSGWAATAARSTDV